MCYASKLFLIALRGGRVVEKKQLEPNLVQRVTVDISIATIYRVLFGPEYIALVSTVEFNFLIISMWDTRFMRDIEFK